MFGRIAPTRFDIRFSLLGVPVRINPIFWLGAILLGARMPDWLPIWVPVLFVSVLVHEMGHALVIRGCGWQPSILFYMFGGLSIYQPTYRSPIRQILVSLAGPAAGFLLVGAILLGAVATRHPVHFEIGLPLLIVPWVDGIADGTLNVVVGLLLLVNTVYGIINLLPVFPLDGGKVLRELLQLLRIAQAPILSLWISLTVAAGIAAYGIAVEYHELAILFGLLAVSNFRMLQAYRSQVAVLAQVRKR